jgi:amino acid permease
MKAPTPVFVVGICLTIAFVNLVTAPMSVSRPGPGFLVGYIGTPIAIAVVYLGWYWARHRKVR